MSSTIHLSWSQPLHSTLTRCWMSNIKRLILLGPALATALIAIFAVPSTIRREQPTVGTEHPTCPSLQTARTLHHWALQRRCYYLHGVYIVEYGGYSSVISIPRRPRYSVNKSEDDGVAAYPPQPNCVGLRTAVGGFCLGFCMRVM